ncbi:MAG: hypothetical protein LBP76_00735 [Treponema sp.]|jgi:hypothetical protein|nr:hypothetical protein [Treponema sp.]
MINFSISAIDLDDDELRRRFDEIGMDAYQEIRMKTAAAQGARRAMDILGADWSRQPIYSAPLRRIPNRVGLPLPVRA